MLLVIAAHPSNTFKRLAIQRMLECMEAAAAIISVSLEFERAVIDMVTAMLPGGQRAVVDRAYRLQRGENANMLVRVVTSPNDRYDTGKWCKGLKEALARGQAHAKGYSKAWYQLHFEYVVLANDSIYMLRPMPELLAALATKRYDMVGPVRSTEGWGETPATYRHGSVHLMSFLRYFLRPALAVWQNYSCTVRAGDAAVYANKRNIVIYHEIGSSQLYEAERIYAPLTANRWHLNESKWAQLLEGDLSTQELGAGSWPHFAVAKKKHIPWWCPASHLASELAGAVLGARAAGSLLNAMCLKPSFGKCPAITGVKDE